MTNKKEQKKKKVSFPHMGTISYAWAAALRIIGCEPYVEPYTSILQKPYVFLIS